MGHWYCTKCRRKREPSKVSFFKKRCKVCGNKVIWVDVTKQLLFSPLQNDFYLLTGKEPLECNSGKVLGTTEYVQYLEDRFWQEKIGE